MYDTSVFVLVNLARLYGCEQIGATRMCFPLLPSPLLLAFPSSLVTDSSTRVLSDNFDFCLGSRLNSKIKVIISSKSARSNFQGYFLLFLHTVFLISLTPKQV
jgi:hypothetical protein